MERRQAIAWAGSIALFGCVSTLLLGSLAGGFGFNITQPPLTQVIGPGALPQPSEERPATDPAPPPPVSGNPAPEAGPGDPEPAPASAGTLPAPDPAPNVDHYPDAPAGYAKLLAAIPLSQPSPTGGSRNVPAPPQHVDKSDAPAEKKAPATIPRKAPLRDLPMVDASNRVSENSHSHVIEEMRRAKIRTWESPSAGKGASMRDRLSHRSKGAGPKVEANGGKARGQDDSHDG
jgi:hypothetical protein